ncbi:TIGR03857 family LLM class F420-dependent oxidoreductase [Mycobacterium sp. E1747]|uniref:TIGR03857 family LLM class F420-dependent oxidoreductase n=1 Tax=Mycobacterium sp. E1747 TaxID=1834128 RepID=UPI0009EDC6AC|nr:TIGR03857 family LLM class F420-dependent oxidoreductase [Mycobacterium sp. E1747]
MTGHLVDVLDDMSAFVLGGRLRSTLPDGVANVTEVRTPAMGLDDAVAAESIGYRRVWLSERFNIKEAATLLSGMAAKTTRLEIATGVVRPTDRHPKLMAATAATMQACYGNRFVLGLGRGDAEYNRIALGMAESPAYVALVDYVDILRRLWAGERVDYAGPAGTFNAMAFGDVYEGDPPPVFYGSFGGKKAATAVAAAFDGILLCPLLTPEATARAKANVTEACEAIGRDPATVRIAQSVITAPELDDLETRQLCHARAVTYMQIDHWARATVIANNWSLEPALALQNHDRFRGMPSADEVFHRRELMDAVDLIPEDWISSTCATGALADCVAKLEEFKAAGADEIVTYGSAPQQNAALLDRWRRR